jgi:hypothetical protein
VKTDESADKKAQILRVIAQSEIRIQHCASACYEGQALSAGDLHKNARDGAS